MYFRLFVTAATRGEMLIAMAVLGLLFLIDAATPSYAQQADERTWRLKAPTDQSPWLAYGTDNAEDTSIVFNCKIGSGIVEVFIGETSKALKPGRSMTGSLIAGSVTSKLPGRTLPNEEAGVPSFEGKLPATDPLFAALSKATTLAMAVGPWRQRVPLKDIGDKAMKFTGLCRKR